VACIGLLHQVKDRVAEFQSRRRATWRAIRGWLLIALGCVATIAGLFWNAYGPASESRIRSGLILLLVTVTCGFIVNSKIRRLYRCPECNQVPIRTVPGWQNEFGDEAQIFSGIHWNARIVALHFDKYLRL
jgi:hypothetical protein